MHHFVTLMQAFVVRIWGKFLCRYVNEILYLKKF
jgi:hypothetical protein